MKKTVLTLGCLLFVSTAALFAKGILKQAGKITRETPTVAVERCSVLDHEAYLQSQNPNRATEVQAYEATIQNWITNQANNPTTQAVITIPVVVHVVYNTTAENITDNQVLSQIQVLNEDYSLTNPDASSIPSAFNSVKANCEIQYCMATVDPNGNPTNGIRRVSTSTTTFSTNDAVKFTAQGGDNAWPTTQYLNLWVCDLSGGLLGYGEFPTANATNTFGLVMDYQCFGSNYTSYGSGFTFTNGFDRGRTATHEIGHCFNLRHIWGDDGSACTGSDLCADTPNQADENYGCPTFPSNASCSNGGDMSMNYMDYTNDACMYMFTLNQKARMLAVLNSAPYNALQNSAACQSSSSGVDGGISAIISPGTSLCGTSFVPQVTLRNSGTTTLTSATINYRIDANTNQTFSWTGSLATNATANVTLPSMTTTVGTHTFTAFTSNPNNTTDVNTANDQQQRTFTVSSSGQNLPYSEGFESTTFPQGGMTLNNPDAATTWARTTLAAKTGSASAFMDNFDYNANGEIDEMILPNLNLTSVTNPVMTFQVAYRLYTDPAAATPFSDTLRVWISTDCGTTWTQIYGKWSSTLATVTPVFSTTEFVPTATQWRLETLSLSAYQSYSNVMIKFRHATQYENNLYIDDINIQNTTDVQNLVMTNDVQMYPNPSTGVINMDVNLFNRDNLTINVTNSIGQRVSQVSDENTFGGHYVIDLSNEPNGVYFIEVQTGTEVTTRRVVISH